MTTCFAYPCSVDSGVTSLDLLRYIEILYNNEKKYLNEVYAKKIIEVIPELEDVGVFATMEWDKLEKTFLQSETGKYYRKVETFPIDSTMMLQDYDMFTTVFSKYLTYSCFIDDSSNTQIRNISSSLQSAPYEDEVRILCIIGHGLSQQQAEELNTNPPEFDNKDCKDFGKMKSCCWKWPLTSCDGTEGLGERYTAKSVCMNAMKGDVVVFNAGFLTPEWIVEQLRKRELNKVNGKIFFTLVLLVDSCYSGVWTERIRTKLELDGFKNTRLVVQTSCADNEGSYGQCFIPHWCAIQNENKQGEPEYSDETRNCEQTPTFYDSYHNEGNGVGVLKFFTRGQSLQYNNFNYTVNRGAHRDFIKSFSHGEGEILSYKLTQHKQRQTPMALFLVKFDDQRIIHLHIHFIVMKGINLKLTAVNSYEAIELTADEYMYGEVGTKEKEGKMYRSGIVHRCQTHVEEAGHHNWELQNPWHNGHGQWTMENTQPPFMIRSRSVAFELCNPHEL